MNGIHDMGGMQGFGAIKIEHNEPVFHAAWQARCFSLNFTMGAWRKWNIDASRHAIERMAPADYLGQSYYERWLTKLVTLMLEHGLVTPEEVETGQPAAAAAKATPPLGPEAALRNMRKGRVSKRVVAAAPAFAIGDRVRTNTNSPSGHTRLPRYARGRQGDIILRHGAHVFPDSNAGGLGEAPQHLYTVRFAARALWGAEANPRDEVTLDLWESYLEAI